MKIIPKIWVLSFLCCVVTARKQYQSEPISQTLHYDDDELSSSKNNSPYPQITDSGSSSYRHPAVLPNSHQYALPSAPIYRHDQYQQQPKLFGYYTYPQGPYDAYSKVESPETEEKYPLAQSTPKDGHSEEIGELDYKKPVKKFRAEEPEELQYSHDSEEHDHSGEKHGQYEAEKYKHADDKHDKYPVQKYGHAGDKQSQYPASPYPPPKRDPKLPLYFTMYEKRIIQDPLDKYGKGPWRYLTYGHGITYGSKEPGKVFESGYGYIRALGRDHCKLPENLCPKRDEKPFEYDGRKEPYFGYRPH